MGNQAGFYKTECQLKTVLMYARFCFARYNVFDNEYWKREPVQGLPFVILWRVTKRDYLVKSRMIINSSTLDKFEIYSPEIVLCPNGRSLEYAET